MRPTARKEVVTMANKITYVSALTTAIENPSALTANEIEKLIALRETVAKRNSTKSTKPTKTQVANEGFANDILSAMVRGTSYSIPDLRHDVDSISDLTSQKIAPIMTKLAEQNKVIRETIKGKIYYRLAD